MLNILLKGFMPRSKMVAQLLLFFSFFFPDYDTEKTVVCSSRYIYDESRQRSLQHFIEFEELPEKDKSIGLPSGTYAGKYLIKTQVEDANNTV